MSNNLENQAPADTFKSLLQTGNNNGVQGTITPIRDGKGDPTALAISSNAAQVNGAFLVTGNFTVNGTTTTINTQTLEIEDQTLVIASNVDHTALLQPSGIFWGNNATNPPQLTYQEGIGFNFSGGDLLKDGNLYGISQLAVTAAGGAFSIDGDSRKTLNLQRGLTYRFDQSDASNANHPLKFSTVSDGTHNTPGSEYTVGVITVGTPGQAGAYTQITLTPSTPSLYYYCGNHSGMGGDALGSITIDSDGNVGVGTNSPDFKLTVDNGIGNEGLKVIAGNNGDSAESVFEAWNNKVNGSAPELLFKIQGNGNVGINNTTPSASLDIVNTNSTTTQSHGLSVQGGGDSTGSGYSLRALDRSGNVDFFVRGDGRVGIGTAAPNAKVDARGLVSATNGMVRATGWFAGDAASHGLGCEIGISSFNGNDTGYLMTYDRSASQYGNTMIQSNNAMVKVVGVGETTVELNGNTVRMRRIVDGGFSETDVQIDGTLRVTSTTGGVILPRVTNEQMTAISATSGEMVFNTTDGKFYGYATNNGTNEWVALH